MSKLFQKGSILFNESTMNPVLALNSTDDNGRNNTRTMFGGYDTTEADSLREASKHEALEFEVWCGFDIDAELSRVA